jgi:hypothetical protein
MSALESMACHRSALRWGCAGALTKKTPASAAIGRPTERCLSGDLG